MEKVAFCSRMSFAAALALVTLASVAACGGGVAAGPEPETGPPAEPAGPPPVTGPAHARGAEAATARVGPAGGTLELANGARLEIPRGALSEEVELTFAIGATTRAFEGNENIRAVGPVVAAEPGVSLGVEATVSIPAGAGVPGGFHDEDLALAVEVVGEQRALSMSGTQTRWENFRARREGDRFTARLPELPGNRLQFIVSR